LKDRYRLDSAIEIRGQEVPEDLRPKEPFESGSNLIGTSSENDEARPVVLDELAHGVECCG